jgi:hypothetical protein
MKRLFLLSSLVLLFNLVAFAQHQHTATAPSVAPIELLPGMGSLSHPVSTTNAEAQKFFDQGLTLIYAFNYRDARRSFQRAAALDPQLAIAHWGIALALGSFINHQVTLKDQPVACAAILKALALSAPPHERALIVALAQRYSTAPDADLQQLERNYSQAMAGVYAQYPDDPDVATLYAESLMNLHPWKLWRNNGTPEAGTEEMVAVLEKALQRHPAHPGANHYYIHALEASPHPERTLSSATRLSQDKYGKAAAHLIHMPAHTWLRTGDYAASVASAEEADRVAGHFMHNLMFLFVARSRLGSFAETKSAADLIVAEAQTMLKRSAVFEVLLPAPLLAMARYQKWDEILAQPQPDAAQRYNAMVWHWARGMALAGKGNVRDAEAMLQTYRKLAAEYPNADEPAPLNSPRAEFTVAEWMLTGKIKLAAGEMDAAIAALRAGVQAEDALNFDEPPTWIFPVREALGSALLRKGDFAAAEQVFRDDLKHNRRNARSLFGLAESLRRQKKDYAALLVEQEFKRAWPQADIKLNANEL